MIDDDEEAGRIQSSDPILGAAAANERTVERQRRPSQDDSARQAIRRQLQRRSPSA